MIPIDTRLRDHAPGATLNRYGMDRSGEKTYAFNSLGYRGEEYNPDAKIKFAVVGCSNVFGTGLNQEETLGHHFKTFLAAANGLELSEVNCFNFGVGGTSNEYGARTILSQVEENLFDLVIFNLTPAGRWEYLDEEGFHSVKVGSVDPEALDKLPPYVAAYYDLHNYALGNLMTIKNILLVQFFLRQIGTPLIISNDWSPLKNVKNPALQPLVDLVDHSIVHNHKFRSQRADSAADGTHVGPITNKAAAITLLRFYGGLLGRKSDAAQMRRIETYYEEALSQDPDWLFCQARAKSGRKNLAIAIRAAEEAIALRPDNRFAQLQLRKLRSQIEKREGKQQMPKKGQRKGNKSAATNAGKGAEVTSE
ncbi:MAG: hypothetical protein RIC85_02420 [Gammaproteobacteria bacterium]